jgi:hypothetical protein
MKYGKRCKNRYLHKGCPTSRYVFNDITYIVNDYSGEEITSYAKPLTLDKVPIDTSTFDMLNKIREMIQKHGHLTQFL